MGITNLGNWQKILKWFILSVLVLISLFILILYFSFSYFLDPEELKKLIIAQCRSQLQREVLINGELTCRFLPHLSLQINNLYVKEEPQAYLERAKVGSIKLEINLLPILWRKLEVKELTLSDLSLELRARGAKLNFLSEGLPYKNRVISTATERGFNPRFKFKKIALKNGRITYQDTKEKKWDLEGLDCNFSEISPMKKPVTYMPGIFKLLHFGGEIKLGKLFYEGKSVIQQAVVSWINTPEGFELKLLKGKLNDQGVFEGRGVCSLNQAGEFSAKVTNLDLAAWGDYFSALEGKLNLNVRYLGSLVKPAEARIEGDFAISPGFWREFNLEREIYKLLLPFMDLGSYEAGFEVLSGRFSFSPFSHLLEITELLLQTKNFRGQGVGLLDLSKKQSAVRIEVNLNRFPLFKLPLTLSGSFSRPRLSIDLDLKKLIK